MTHTLQLLLSGRADPFLNYIDQQLSGLNWYQRRRLGVGFVAWESQVTEEQAAQIRPLLMQWRDNLGVDINLLGQQASLSLPGILQLDMDSTLIAIECIDELAVLAGVGDEVASLTAAAMRGELDFEQSLRQRVGQLAGASQDILHKVARDLPMMPGAEQLLAILKHHGWKLGLASGGFDYFTQVLQARLGLDNTMANQLEIVDGVLTGQVLGEVVDADAKVTHLKGMMAQYQIPLAQTVTMGDGANDLPMLNAAGMGVACHAKPKVEAQAPLVIRHMGLDALLLMLGE